ncbi:alpha/beta hydrolase [Gracilimonas sediminicola]|uniref:Alpha/beta hydrolase-fold protein n=1 Tax=Gracilimonas sediminicola TaxID=2952158 RepID=A0A9X2L4G2_9BACT|nr:alpha/beta hydrolase-fold protein [Gracilimonas sediminicola]MCP9292206.1 alpha/beta hydrolase-fold protein [Gracilimonas sediminicola]
MRHLLIHAQFRILLFSLIFTTGASAQTADTLFFSIDMTGPVSEGWFEPGSEKVGIRGDQPPLSWGTTYQAADPNKDGVYEVAVPFKLNTDSLLVSFKIKVDGVENPDEGWQAGRNHEVMIYKGMQNSVALAWGDRPPEAPVTITGHVEIIRDFESENLLPRDLYIYLPPNYKESDRRYPVLYMHDGQALFDASEIGQEWKVDEAAEELIGSGEIAPVIIVGIGNTQDRIDEYTPSEQIWRHELKRVSPAEVSSLPGVYSGDFKTVEGDTIRFRTKADTLYAMIPGGESWQSLIPKTEHSFYLPQAGITFSFEASEGQGYKLIASKPSIGGKGDVYGEFILNKVKPFVDENFRTKPGKEFTALGGSSLGGLITLYLGLEYPDVFSKLLVVSPSVWWDGRMIINEVDELKGSTDQHIWLDMGTAEGEGAVESAEVLQQILVKKGWSDENLHFIIEEGAAHNERAWAKRVPDMLRFLYSTR